MWHRKKEHGQAHRVEGNGVDGPFAFLFPVSEVLVSEDSQVYKVSLMKFDGRAAGTYLAKGNFTMCCMMRT